MKLAFCLFKYFPYGGLQRDFLRIARLCHERGHEIHVYTMSWEGEPEPGFQVHFIPAKGWQNHVRCYSFAKKLAVELDKTPYDLVIGFNKMPNLDVYYAADVCYQTRMREKHGTFFRLLPRYRQMVALEQAVFSPESHTEILLIAAQQEKKYRECYRTQPERFHLLPPGIERNRIAPDNAAEIRASMRASLQLKDDQLLLLMVGSGFKTKGVSRSIRALSALPETLRARCQLFVIGQDNPGEFIEKAKQLKVDAHVRFLGGRPDVPQFLLAADVLMHPSFHENTGTAILEALVAGLPVLTVDVCGYAHYVEDAAAGIVVPSPFHQTVFNAALKSMLASHDNRHVWHNNALAFAKTADIYSLPDKAVNFIEHIGPRRALLPSI